ncbi:MAG: hypothetical protein WC488_01875 [Candidatus Micrarchaeia archaeon]
MKWFLAVFLAAALALAGCTSEKGPEAQNANGTMALPNASDNTIAQENLSGNATVAGNFTANGTGQVQPAENVSEISNSTLNETAGPWDLDANESEGNGSSADAGTNLSFVNISGNLERLAALGAELDANAEAAQVLDEQIDLVAIFGVQDSGAGFDARRDAMIEGIDRVAARLNEVKMKIANNTRVDDETRELAAEDLGMLIKDVESYKPDLQDAETAEDLDYLEEDLVQYLYDSSEGVAMDIGDVLYVMAEESGENGDAAVEETGIALDALDAGCAHGSGDAFDSSIAELGTTLEALRAAMDAYENRGMVDGMKNSAAIVNELAESLETAQESCGAG